jgi:RimJ/RimL family protein N-acetyltransferase
VDGSASLARVPDIETERLRLRRFTTDDAVALAELHADARVMRFIDDGRPVARELTVRETLPRILGQYAQVPAGLGKSALVENPSGRFVGWVGLGPSSSVGLAVGADYELGYRLHPGFWRRGYASEAAKGLVDYAFAEHALPRIVATTMTVNLGSRKVMENAGLRYVRTFFEQWPEYIEGAEHGDVEYALDLEAWQGSQKA